MNKVMKIKNNRKGMTLIELLTVILILAILGALTTVAVVRHRRNLKLYEMDNTAKEIFVAAQNHLSVMKVEGLLPESGRGETKVCHLVYNGKSASVISSNSGKEQSVISGTGDTTDAENIAAEEWEEMLPQGAIDETIRVSGSYIISYDPANAVIKDVFYSDNYQFSSTTDFTETEGTAAYSEELTKAKTDKEVRKHFNNTNHVIGYYGGARADSVPVESLHDPVLSVSNGDQLKVEVSLNEADEKRTDIGSVELIVTIGNKKKVLAGEIPPTASMDASDRKGARTCTFLLDDVTASGSDQLTPKGFVDLFRKELNEQDSTYKLGEDISVQAVVLPKNTRLDETGTKIISSGWSEKKTVNPLFADVEDKAVMGDKTSAGGKASAEDYTSVEDQTAAGEKIAVISSFRHLINLQTFNDYDKNTETYGHSKKLSISSAKQTSDMDWASFVKEGNVSNPGYSYVPLTLDKDFSYDGQYYRIVNLKIGSVDGSKGTGSGKGSSDDVPSSAVSVSDGGDGGQAAGLFGSVSKHLTVQNVVLDDFVVYGSNAGALVGEVTEAGQLTVRGVLARAYDNSRRIHGTENAGGLIGRIVGSVDAANPNGSEISLSSASVYVEGGTNAGGLIGSAANTKIKDCYTAGHTKNGEYIQDTTGNDVRMNVQATGKNGIAGGLVGSFSGSSFSVSASYSTASVYGKMVGTLIGNSDNATKIEDATVYGSGFAMDTDKQQVTALIGNNTGLNGYDYRSFKQGDRISYRYDAIANKDGEKSTIIGFALPGIPDLDISLESTDAAAVPFFIRSHFGDWKILDQVKEKKICFVDFYTYDSEGKLVPYTDDPMVRFIQPKTEINRQGVMEGGSAYVPKEAPEGKFIKFIDFYLTDTAVDKPSKENLSPEAKNTYDPNKPVGLQYTYAKNNNGTDKTDFSNVNKNIIAVVNLQAIAEIAGRVQLKASFFDTDQTSKSSTQTIAYPKAVDGSVSPVEPVYAGYTFEGWYSDENCTSDHKLTVNSDGTIPVGERHTIYARYEKKPDTIKSVAFVLEVQGGNGKTTSLGTMLAHTASKTLGKIRLRNYENIQPQELYRWDGSVWEKVKNPAFGTDSTTLTLNDDLSSAAPYDAAGTDAAYKIVYTGDMVSYKVQYIFQNTNASGLNAENFYSPSQDGASYNMTKSVDALPYSAGENDRFVIETEESTVKGMLATAKPLNFKEGDQGKFIQSEIDGNNVVLNGDDGEHTIKVYFTRKSYYLTYDFQSGIYHYTDSDGQSVRSGMKASELHMYGETFNLLNDSEDTKYVQKEGYTLADGKEWYLVADQAADASQSYASLSADQAYPSNLASSSLRSCQNFVMPAENVHAVANWKMNSEATITVEIFRQNVNHESENYDYYTTIENVGPFYTSSEDYSDSDKVLNLENIFKAILSSDSKNDKKPSDSPRYRTSDSDENSNGTNKYPSYNFYDFNTDKTQRELDTKTVNADGSTVIQLYYKRENINFVFDYGAYNAPGDAKETEVTVNPVTVHKLTRTENTVSNNYQYLQRDSNGSQLKYLTRVRVYLNANDGKYYYTDGWKYYPDYPIDAANVVQYRWMNGKNRYVLVGKDIDADNDNFYFAPDLTADTDGKSFTYRNYDGTLKKVYKNDRYIYSVQTGTILGTSVNYQWDTIKFVPKPVVDNWMNVWGTQCFGHEITDESNVYYFSENYYQYVQKIISSTEYDDTYKERVLNRYKQYYIIFKDVPAYSNWNKDGKLVNKHIVSWTGLYEEPLNNYAYQWDSDYSWSYTNGDKMGITFLTQFSTSNDDGSNPYMDSNNTVYFRTEEKNSGNYEIYHCLQKLPDNSDSGNDLDFEISSDYTQKTIGSTFYLTDKFLGFSVYGYNRDFKDKQIHTIAGQNNPNAEVGYPYGDLYVYHVRNTYHIYVENTGLDSRPDFRKLYQQAVKKIDVSSFKNNPPSGVGSDYVFTGLYDSAATDGTATRIFDENGDIDSDYLKAHSSDGGYVVQAHDMQLFAHWEAPKVKVFFNLSDNSNELKDLTACEAAVKKAGDDVELVASDSEKNLYKLYKVTNDLYYVEMSQDTATLDTAVKATASLTENLTATDSDGNTYKFGAWSLAKDSLQEYIASSAVIDDAVLYPHWNQTAGTARIQINVVGADGGSLLRDLDKSGWTEDKDTGIWTKDNWELDSRQNILYWKGKMHTSGVIEAPAINGYTPYVSAQTINDITPVSDPITFTYTSSKNVVWTYQVNYVVDFGSGMKWTIKSETHSSENASEIVTADLNLDGYYLKGILNADGKTVNSSAYKILSRNAGIEDDHKDSVPTVTFVYEAMTDEVFKLTGNSQLYNGTPCQAKVTYIGEGNGMFARLSKKTVIEYSEDGKKWTTDAPVYAGSYQVQAKVIFMDADGKEYTVWTGTSDSSDQYVNIIPRSIFLESASYVFELKEDQYTYQNTTVRVRGDGFLKGDGVKIHNQTSVPKGTSSLTPNNYFTYTFDTSGSKTQAYYERNYIVQRVFGTLRVQTTAVPEVNAEWGDPKAEQDYTLIGT